MDGLPLPPPAAALAQVGQQPGFPLPPPPGQPAPHDERRPVGRPSGDPERDAERAKRQAERSRLDSVLPGEAKDSRIAIYRLTGPSGTVRMGKRPIIKVLVSDVENAVKNNTEPNDFIKSLIIQRCGNKGRYQCEPQDFRGLPLPNYAAWEIDLDDMEGDAMDEEELEGVNTFDNQAPWLTPGSGMPPPPPGPAPQTNFQEIVRDVQELSQREYEKGQEKSRDTLALVMQMSQQAAAAQAQSMQAMMMQMQQSNNQMMQMMIAVIGGDKSKNEEAERRAAEQAERERARRDDMLKWVGTVLMPLLAPVLARLTEKQQDMAMPLLLDLIKNGQNNNASKELMAMMSEATKSQIAMQAEASKQAIAAAGETNKHVISHVLNLSKQVTEQMLEAAQTEGGGGEGSEPDMLDKFGKLMSVLSPILQNNTATPPPTMRAPMIAPQAIEAVVAPPQAQPSPAAVAAPAGASQPPNTVTDAEVIRACLYDIRKLEMNEIPAPERIRCLTFWTTKLPRNMVAALQAGQQDQVFEIAGPVVGSDQNLIGWISGAGVGNYVEDCLKEMRKILHQEMDENATKASVARHIDYIQRKGLQPLMGRPGAPVSPPPAAPAAPAIIPSPAGKKRGPPPVPTAPVQPEAAPAEPPPHVEPPAAPPAGE